ncbi:MAG: hypothetical protein E6X63_08135 [Pseudomonas aeruginosa]|uniref:hypothetical protein n=1 Tax=Pseudomonas aeruginosa TaxID=287 RepID=UPI0005B7AE25|nr:hypothetical protein [Pseudomonas aeruginosa]MDU5684552.1 hypothetical protein [Kluyvera cryocrescens]EKW6682293.1 hypothetical protein [Pseudomonas aeruginosa]EKX3798030.1 hypothetical protein [Pseudomonas aeruginosa]MBH3854206.1 hypothetical protein [Pseudomonas aeruginosa]MBH3953197.1 hypothetical protein [Pseudomonas aeruginosa]
MKERPILFTGPMVHAILEGRKTVTRRVVKPQPDFLGSMVDPNTPFKTLDAGLHARITCPYGQPGDRLWVRETWGLQVRSYGGGAGEFIVYRATNPDAIYCRSSEGREYPVKWKPGIHMRRHSSRILLEITAVRVERLQDISEEQALAEGVRGEPCDHARQACSDIGCWGDTAKGAFGFLWEQLSGAGAWQANPWVWVVEFKRVTP